MQLLCKPAVGAADFIHGGGARDAKNLVRIFTCVPSRFADAAASLDIWIAPGPRSSAVRELSSRKGAKAPRDWQNGWKMVPPTRFQFVTLITNQVLYQLSYKGSGRLLSQDGERKVKKRCLVKRPLRFEICNGLRGMLEQERDGSP